MMKLKKEFYKIIISISLALTLFFKIRDSAAIRGLACGLRSRYGCSFGKFILQFITWFIVISIAVFILGYAFVWLGKQAFSEEKEKKNAKKEAPKEEPKEEKPKKKKVIKL